MRCSLAVVLSMLGVLQLLQPLQPAAAAPRQLNSSERDEHAQAALRSFCQTFSGRTLLCGPARRTKRSKDDIWTDILANGDAKMPDTKWCGAGTSATSYDDLGSARATDLCCRQHDHCPVSLEAGEARGGVTNTGHFTRSDCECDAAFFHCLVKAATVHSQLVGELYFNLLEPDCIESSTTRSERREEAREDQNQAKDQEPSEDQDQDRDRDRSRQRAVRLRFVTQPLAGQFPEPPNEEAMADRAEALAARALGVFTAGR